MPILKDGHTRVIQLFSGGLHGDHIIMVLELDHYQALFHSVSSMKALILTAFIIMDGSDSSESTP